MAASVARRVAYEVLLRVETQGAYADELLRARLERGAGQGRKGAPVSREDAALATELVMGVLRWQRRLDDLLENYLNNQGASNKGATRKGGTARESAAARGPATARLDAEVRVALRMGAYQVGWLERVPARAAVHESVELVKAAGKASAAGLVNAVLRRVAEEQDKQKGGHPSASLRAGCGPPLRLPPGLPAGERLGIAHSHPTWLVERWLRAFGEQETVALLESNNRVPRATCAVTEESDAEALAEELRANGFDVRAGRWLRGALDVSRGDLSQARAFREGRVQRQDEASQMVALLLDVRPGMRMLDVCAAPGGKTATLARAAGADGLVVAADVHEHRLARMRERWRGRASDSHLQAGQVACVALDGTASLPFSGEFARILVDAPCSGTGTLARNPEIRWRLRLEDLPELAARQRALLERAAERLAAGGTLVYSTCSLEPEENEQVVEWFLGRHPKFELKSGWEALEPHLRGGLAVAPNDNESQILDCRFQKGVEQSSAKTEAALFEVHGFFQTLPHRHGTDGFFAAVLVKNP